VSSVVDVCGRAGTPDAEQAAEAAKDEDEMTEEERIAQLGKPRLGDIVAINVHIRESIEFKVPCITIVSLLTLLMIFGHFSVLTMVHLSFERCWNFYRATLMQSAKYCHSSVCSVPVCPFVTLTIATNLRHR